MDETFVGRQSELAQLSNWFELEDKVALVHGLAGIGKTSLAVRFVEQKRSTLPILWFTASQMDTPESLITALAGLLSKIKRVGLQSLINQAKSMDTVGLDDFVEMAARELSLHPPSMIVVDGLDLWQEPLLTFVQQLIQRCHSSPAGPKWLLLTRDPETSADVAAGDFFNYTAG